MLAFSKSSCSRTLSLSHNWMMDAMVFGHLWVGISIIAHTSFAALQFHTKWISVSFSCKQIGQAWSKIILLVCRLDLVGREVLWILHKKFLTFFGMEGFQKSVKRLLLLLEAKPPLSLFTSSVVKYALLTVNLQCSVKDQISLSSLLLIPKGIFNIVWHSSFQKISFII